MTLLPSVVFPGLGPILMTGLKFDLPLNFSKTVFLFTNYQENVNETHCIRFILFFPRL